ncbi:HD domain-containing phosphohydrolase [Miltoncostaea oceani]|uniref:HD domain-containing phosphohydrolase n=1 Tax=Miltoncostaea oceani TaxID=2843216 RepID=UPI001C3E25F8|nr:HD domain-containing phosphohydrolase [Miltoncostaea oceani]
MPGPVPAVRRVRAALRRPLALLGGARLRPLQVVVVVAIAGAGLAASAAVATHARADHRDAHTEWAGRAAATIRDELDAAGSNLTAARGLFAAGGPAVDAAAFGRFAAVELVDSQVLSLNWAERVPAASRPRYERLHGTIRAPDASGRITAAPARGEHFPLTFTAPASPAARGSLGVDLAGRPALRATLARARDGARPVVTPALSLDRGRPTAVALLAAVYGPDPSPSTVAARRSGLGGYVGGVFPLTGLAAPAAALLPEGGGLRITDRGTTLADIGPGRPRDAVGVARVAGTTWTVKVALPGAPAATSTAVLTPALGAAAVALLFAVLFGQANGRRRERGAAAARLRHEADTDGLTGLANRRRLERDLAAAARERSPLTLVMLDLNGFKGYNDRFGHPAGDALLVRLSARLAAAAPGAAYRLGGDEFCVLVPGGGRLGDTLDRVHEALRERGDGFQVTAAHGVARLPVDATTPDAAMLVADHRMYAHKGIGRQSAGSQSADVLVRALAERHPDLEEHTDGVADLADRVARRLGLGETARGEVRRAARLHDVGKVAIPDSILDKPAPLDAAELAFVRRHTVIGERILRVAPSLAPIAALVRSSHERWDGAGYPDGLAGEDIPRASRIVFACDAYEAMTSPRRPYRDAIPPGAALAEIAACAGTQFDPQVAAVLVEVVRGDLAGAAARRTGVVSPA